MGRVEALEAVDMPPVVLVKHRTYNRVTCAIVYLYLYNFVS